MNLDPQLDAELRRYAATHQHRLVEIIRDLVRIPSENTAPLGAEGPAQDYVAAHLRRHGWDPLVYPLSEVPGLTAHPLYWPGREYAGRPNVGARQSGAGGGRSLVLSGHIDTVPKGTQPWTRDPFGGEVEGNLLYGRGSNDMKGGVGTNLFVVEALAELGIRLAGDLVFETVVDEEFGGVNGTLAGRLMGFNADAAIISEPSFLRVCPAQRGGRIVHITLRAETAGVLSDGRFAPGIAGQLQHLLSRVPQFAELRRRTAPVHELYAESPDPVPVSVTRIFTAPWGTGEPTTVPDSCQVELYWQTMPGEEQAAIEQQFHEWFRAVIDSAPELFSRPPETVFPLRWLPGSAISPDAPLVRELAACSESVLGAPPVVAGIEGPCDLFAFQQGFGIPGVLWGARGGRTHSADEYLEIDSAVKAATVLLLFVCRWCGVDHWKGARV